MAKKKSSIEAKLEKICMLIGREIERNDEYTREKALEFLDSYDNEKCNYQNAFIAKYFSGKSDAYKRVSGAINIALLDNSTLVDINLYI